MKRSECARLASLHGQCDYHSAHKAEFKRLSRRLLKAAAELLGLPKESYDLRYNAAGVAVSGDATLHHETFYVQANAEMDWILVRSCKGRKDYMGGANLSYPYARLRDEGAEGLAAFVRSNRLV